MKNNLVVIGFANSRGVISKKIVEEQFHVIERARPKEATADPKVKPRALPTLDLDIFKNLISRRRNQTLLTSFLGISNDDANQQLLEMRDNAQKELINIKDELNTISIFAAEMNLNNFIKETKANEEEAIKCMAQFHGNLQLALQGWRDRQKIIKRFAEKNQMTDKEAKAILQANQYNAAVFD